MVKLLQLTVSNHPVLGSQTIDFVDKNEVSSSRYVTLIIGQNGTGKTQILKALIDILVIWKDGQIRKAKPRWAESYDFSLFMQLDTMQVSIKSEDGRVVSSLVPEVNIDRLIVSSYTFNDKFPKSEEEAFYYYGGLKTTSNNIFLNRPIEETFRNLAKVIKAKNKIENLNELFNELNFDKKIKVIYRKGRYFKFLDEQFRLFLNRSISLSDNGKVSKYIIDGFVDLYKKTIAFGETRTRRFQETGISRVLENENDIRSIIEYFFKTDERAKIELEFEFDWERDGIDSAFFKHLDVYKLLSDLDLISFGNFQISRKSYFNFEDTSSGEFHLIHLTSSILANIKEHSIVLVDEPEISLHVNWQNRFFKLLEPIIKNYPKCHFIIASHSHFLVSNLHNDWSSILFLKRNLETSELVIRLLREINPEGWSAEQILFDVFDVATDRNYYLSKLVEDIVAEIGKTNPNKSVLDELFQKLKKYNISDLNDIDPMKQIIKSLLSYDMA